MTLIEANWPAPAYIKAYTTTRNGGVSKPPYDFFNLGDHVREDTTTTLKNRSVLKNKLNLNNEPIWLNQTHSTIAIKANPHKFNQQADASFTDQKQLACVILTADCLPILLCNKSGTHVAAIHAGWRGLANGIIESTLNALKLPANEILAWLGPAISQQHYEVGDEVKEYISHSTLGADQAFIPSPNKRWLADLSKLGRLRLQQNGITHIYGGTHCTYADKQNFYSYRRDGAATGRMASLIWIVD